MTIGHWVNSGIGGLPDAASKPFLVPIRLVEPYERINKPAVPQGGDAVFRVQVFEIRAVQHEKRMIDCREMDKKDCGSGERSYSKRSGKESRFLGG